MLLDAFRALMILVIERCQTRGIQDTSTRTAQTSGSKDQPRGRTPYCQPPSAN